MSNIYLLVWIIYQVTIKSSLYIILIFLLCLFSYTYKHNLTSHTLAFSSYLSISCPQCWGVGTWLPTGPWNSWMFLFSHHIKDGWSMVGPLVRINSLAVIFLSFDLGSNPEFVSSVVSLHQWSCLMETH